METKYNNLIKLKSTIESNKLSNSLLIFINSEPFLTHQYITEIAKQRKLKIENIEKFDELLTDSDIFSLDSMPSNTLRIVNLDDFKCTNKKGLSITDCIIVCNTIKDKETSDLFEASIINFPKLTDWNVKDYVYSNSNISDRAKDWLLDTCKNNIYRIQQELDKLNIFNRKDQPELFDEFVQDGIFSDLSSFNIFDFINAIISKDREKVKTILSERENIDIEPLGVVTLLYNNLRNIIGIQMNPNATAESLGLSPKQFVAIRYRVNKYPSEKLINIFNTIIKIDEQLKTGYLDNDEIIDYILINIFD